MAENAVNENVWLDANRFYDAERHFYEVSVEQLRVRGNPGSPDSSSAKGMSQLASSLASEIANARQKIHNFLKSPITEVDAPSRLEKIELEIENQKQDIERVAAQLKDVLSELSLVKDLFSKLNIPNKEISQVNKKDSEIIQNESTTADDDVDLFGSDEENEEEKKLKEERIKAYADKKSKKPALVAKSSIVLDIKPWDDETDMKTMETAVRKITSDGLLWGASKLVPLAYGIHKLQIVAIVEDEKVSVQWLQEIIEEIEDLVQSVDIAAFNKL